MGQSVNKKTLSEVFGISEPTFTKYQKQGLPFMRGRSKGNSNTYDTEDVFRWLISKELSVRQEDGSIDTEQERGRTPRTERCA